MFTEDGRRYIDFFAGAGALNYGHNPDFIKQKLIDYLLADRIAHGLDMYTVAKREFLQVLNEVILAPRGMKHKCMFCGPTGTNAVEAALKIARKAKGRSNVFAFQGGFHGMTLGSLSATGNSYNRGAAGVALGNITHMPFPHGFSANFDTLAYMEQVLTDTSSGIEKPAAVLLETIQAEGGVIPCGDDWLRGLRALCDRHDIALIVDDIQVGCGRTGTFFSFERAGIQPDIITLSKSISGYGLPMAVVLVQPELDVFRPGEHNGTFRGHQFALLAGATALNVWRNLDFADEIQKRSEFVEQFLRVEILPLNDQLQLRGRGLIWGVDFSALQSSELVETILSNCFENGLIIENSGRRGMVIKLLPALNISIALLEEGCTILRDSCRKFL
jgi:diaminobutyrate-2-oxoglutarate transaminase